MQITEYNHCNKNSRLVTHDTNSQHSRNLILKIFETKSYKRLAIYTIIILAVLTAIILSIAFSLNLVSRNDDYFPNSNEEDTEEKTLGSHKLYYKNKWGGRLPLAIRPLKHPTEYVIISHTAGNFCNNLKECAAIMRQIQSQHVAELKSPDIGYNFLIGGDGNIYVGRDWDAINFHDVNNIGVSFMGNFVYEYLTPAMISALKELLAFGVKQGKLPADYKLVCHNQTYNTLSPGANVYEEISKFPNFYTGSINFD